MSINLLFKNSTYWIIITQTEVSIKLVIHVFALFAWHYILIIHCMPYTYLNSPYSLTEEQLWLTGLF